MNIFARILLSFFVILAVSRPLFAEESQSTTGKGTVPLGPSIEDPETKVSGDKEEKVSQVSIGVQRAFRLLFQNSGESWASTGIDGLGTWCLEILFKVYDKFIGSFLIGIPDMANKSTYSRPGAPEGYKAAAVIGKIYMVTWAFGLFLMLVLSVAYFGISSSGLTNISFSPKMFTRFIVVALLLFAWGPIFSTFTNGFSALGYLIYSQNTLTTGKVFEGLTSMSLDTSTDALVSADQVSRVELNARSIFLNSIGMTWNVVYFLAIVLVAVGMIVGVSALSDNAPEGRKRFMQAAGALLFIIIMPTVLQFLVKHGATDLGKPSATEAQSGYDLYDATTGLSTTGKPSVPSGSGVVSRSTTKDKEPGSINDEYQKQKAVNLEKAVGGLFKILISIWGVLTVVAVVFAKIFQVLSLGIIFILGPVFIGMAAHPSTQSISFGALRLFIKLLAYSPIWALTLVFLYVIPNIDFGIASVGVNSIMTAFCVLAGLQLISNAQEFASMFSNFGGGGASGGNLTGHGWSSPYRDFVAAGAFAGRMKGLAGMGGVVKAGTTAAGAATGGAAMAVAAGGVVASNAIGGAMSGPSGLRTDGPSKSFVTPANANQSVDYMSKQPASTKNLQDLSRATGSTKNRPAPTATHSQDQLSKLNSIKTNMQSSLGKPKGVA